MNRLKLMFWWMFYVPLVIVSCSDDVANDDPAIGCAPEKIIVSEFQAMLDSAKIVGSILIYDPQGDKYYSNDFEWTTKSKLPASTFKIPNSIIALETGNVTSDSMLFKWDGEERGLDILEQDLIFKDAFQFSCVPCYQEVARKIGAQQMNEYLTKLDFGNMLVDSANIDTFWLVGDSRITQMEQVDFLQRFYEMKLPISNRTDSIVKRMMIIEESENFTLRGKTGWSIRNGENNGWFVGIIDANNKTYYFATNIEPQDEFDMSFFPTIRKSISYEAFRYMNLLP